MGKDTDNYYYKLSFTISIGLFFNKRPRKTGNPWGFFFYIVYGAHKHLHELPLLTGILSSKSVPSLPAG